MCPLQATAAQLRLNKCPLNSLMTFYYSMLLLPLFGSTTVFTLQTTPFSFFSSDFPVLVSLQQTHDLNNIFLFLLSVSHLQVIALLTTAVIVLFLQTSRLHFFLLCVIIFFPFLQLQQTTLLEYCQPFSGSWNIPKQWKSFIIVWLSVC